MEAEARRRFAAFLFGIQAYRHHPRRRGSIDPPALWREGSSRLLDYGAAKASGKKARPGGKAAGEVPVLVVPSLINRAYILDLSDKCSLMRYLARRGLRPMLLDWGRPGQAERGFTLTDYVAGRLSRALDAALGATGRRPVVMGYCMGGLLALALAQRRGGDLAGLALLATPWDFFAEPSPQARLAAAAAEGPLGLLIERLGELPVDFLQAMFASLDPLGTQKKFALFAELVNRTNAAGRRAAPGKKAGGAGKANRDPAAARIETFVSLEDWLNDGVPLSAPVAFECLRGWYGRNDPARGGWRIDGVPVRPQALDLPALVILPEHDRIVPPKSAAPLALALPNARVLTPPLGHIGMIVSRQAETLAWRPLARWLRKRH